MARSAATGRHSIAPRTSCLFSAKNVTSVLKLGPLVSASGRYGEEAAPATFLSGNGPRTRLGVAHVAATPPRVDLDAKSVQVPVVIFNISK